MAKSAVNAAVAEDLQGVMNLLKERGVIAVKPDSELMAHARSIHEATYSLISWRFRLRRLPPHGAVYIDEIASDALQILPQILMGYSKTAKLLIRGIVENTLRHIYFSDHPVEFIRMNRDKKWYVSVEQLFDYAKNHFDFLLTEPKFDALNRLNSVYDDLSAGVHGRKVQHLEMRGALEKIRYDSKLAAYDVQQLQKCSQAVNFLLAIFHRQQVRSLQTDERRLILRSMPTAARQVFADHE